jgi:hypothetical protein
MAKKITKTQLAKQQKAFLAEIKTMPKITSRSTDAQIDRLYQWCEYQFSGVLKANKDLSIILRGYLLDSNLSHWQAPPRRTSFTIPADGLSARGWHKDHNNYNKAEKHERTPGQRRTPARNVTRTGAKRIRKTNIKRYK